VLAAELNPKQPGCNLQENSQNSKQTPVKNLPTEAPTNIKQMT